MLSDCMLVLKAFLWIVYSTNVLHCKYWNHTLVSIQRSKQIVFMAQDNGLDMIAVE